MYYYLASDRIVLALLSDATSIVALPTTIQEMVMADAIRTRCKFRVVGVEDTENEHKKLKLLVPANTKHPVDGSESRYDRTEYEPYDPPKYAQNVRLAASYDASNPEDVSFAEATPSGEVKIYVSNPAVIGTFKPGKNYYLDLIPCE